MKLIQREEKVISRHLILETKMLNFTFLFIDLPLRLSRHCMVNLGDDNIFVYGGITFQRVGYT